MSLKILFVPLSLISVLVLLIGYMKPDYDDFILRQATYESSRQQFDQMNTRLGNITSVVNEFSAQFSDALGGKNEEEALVDQYVPESIDQDRVVDAINYLATQSGVLISSIAIEKPAVKTVAAQSEQVASSQAILLNGAGSAVAGSPTDTMASFQAVYPDPNMYQATINMSGDYAAFSRFFDAVYRMNRENEVKVFSLKKSPEKKDDAGNAAKNLTLEGSLVVSFMFYPGLSNDSIKNVEALKVFNAAKLDTKIFDSLKAKMGTGDLPELTVGDVPARENPFFQ
jgi:hypothetical protein